MNMAKNKFEKLQRPADVVFLLCCVGTFLSETFLAYRQIVLYNGKYLSDLSLHIAIARRDQYYYRMIGFLVNTMDHITTNPWALALSMGVLVLLTVIGNYFLIRFFTKRFTESRIPAQIMAVLVLYTGPIYIPKFMPYFYAKTQSKYAWQNPTQIMVTVFSVFALLAFYKVYEHYMEKISTKGWAMLALAFLVSAYAKPSFIMAFFPAAAMILLADLFRKDTGLKPMSRFRQIFILGMTMLPACIYFLLLNNTVFGESRQEVTSSAGGEASKVVIDLGRAYFNQDFSITLSILAGLAFPLFVLLFNLRELKKPEYAVSWLTVLWGYAEHFTFSETGPRATHGNFAWGKKVAIYLVFAVSMAKFIENLYDPDFLKGNRTRKIAYGTALALLLFLHFASQVVYLVHLGHGGKYMI
jgi:hypothetical protein